MTIVIVIVLSQSRDADGTVTMGEVHKRAVTQIAGGVIGLPRVVGGSRFPSLRDD